MATSSLSSPSRFLSSALSTSNPYSLSYIHSTLKWLIHEHLLSLLRDFPTLSLSVGSFTHDDGAEATLLNVHGQLLCSPPVLLTIWLPERYPFSQPFVFVFPSVCGRELRHGRPFVSASSGAAVSDYLKRWQYPSSSLSGLAEELVCLFNICSPYAHESAVRPAQSVRLPSTPHPSPSALADTAGRLASFLQQDMDRFLAQVEVDVEHLLKLQSELRDRAHLIDECLLPALESEREELEEWALRNKEKRWTQIHGESSRMLQVEGELEGFEAVDESSRSLIESMAAELAADDVMDALGRGLEEGVVSFGEYLKKVRGSAREQFFHRALVVMLQG